MYNNDIKRHQFLAFTLILLENISELCIRIDLVVKCQYFLCSYIVENNTGRTGIN